MNLQDAKIIVRVFSFIHCLIFIFYLFIVRFIIHILVITDSNTTFER
jgi:hypothetical protein